MDEKLIKEIQDEIQKLGATSKENYEKLRKHYDELKESIDHNGDEEKINKLVTDISLRQDAIDTKVNQRIDSLEVAMQRLPGDSKDEKEVQKEARQFVLHKLAVKNYKNNEKGVDFRTYAEAVKNINIDEYKQYSEMLDIYLRTQGDIRMLKPEQEKLLQIGIDPDGGYLVTPQMSTRILARMFEGDPIRQLANVQTISTEALEEWVDWGDAGAEWESETVATTNQTTPTWNKKRIGTHPLATRPKATQTMLEDAAINVEAWLSDKVANRFARTEGAAFVSGNGVGKPKGFLDYASGTTYGTVQQIAMGNASNITADGFISIKYGMKEMYIGRGTWLMNRSTLAAAMKLKDGNGDYLWKPGMLASDPYSTLLGLPVRMSTTMPEITASALSVALADWSRAYTIVDRLGITVIKDIYTAKPAVEFYFRKRVGGDVVDFDAIKLGIIST